MTIFYLFFIWWGDFYCIISRLSFPKRTVPMWVFVKCSHLRQSGKNAHCIELWLNCLICDEHTPARPKRNVLINLLLLSIWHNLFTLIHYSKLNIIGIHQWKAWFDLLIHFLPSPTLPSVMSLLLSALKWLFFFLSYFWSIVHLLDNVLC